MLSFKMLKNVLKQIVRGSGKKHKKGSSIDCHLVIIITVVHIAVLMWWQKNSLCALYVVTVPTDVCIKIWTPIHQRTRSIVRLVPEIVEIWSEEL